MTSTIADHQTLSIEKRITKILEGNCKQKDICPIKDILSTFSDKWTIYTILMLGRYQKQRFTELKNHVEGISQRMLTVTLKSLEENGIIIRTIYPVIPPRVEYELTDLGNSLLDPLSRLAGWADDNFAEIIKARKKFTRKPRQ